MPKAAAATKRFLSIAQVAEILGVSPKTVGRWIEKKLLRVHDLGRLVRIAEDDLASFISMRRR